MQVDIVTIISGGGTINLLLNRLLSNVDVVLSIGGAISGILDVLFDKKLNNSIWVI